MAFGLIDVKPGTTHPYIWIWPFLWLYDPFLFIVLHFMELGSSGHYFLSFYVKISVNTLKNISFCAPWKKRKYFLWHLWQSEYRMTDFRVKYPLRNPMRLATHAGDQHLIPNIHWCCIMLIFSAGTYSMASLCLVKFYLGFLMSIYQCICFCVFIVKLWGHHSLFAHVL